MKFNFEDLLINGKIDNIKIGSHKDELDNLFGKEEFGELHEALYLKNSMQCYFDGNDQLEKFKLKLGGLGYDNFFENIFYNLYEHIYKLEHEFSEFWEKQGIRFLTGKPYFYEGKKEEAAILSENNVSLIFNYPNLTHRLKKDRILLDSIWVDSGFSWEHELDILSGNSTPESRNKIHDKYYQGRPYR